MFIVIQDRDLMVPFDPDADTLYTIPRFHEGLLIGFNLHKQGYDEILGTFDSVEQASIEMFLIVTCEEEYCQVNGYDAWEDYEDLIDLMLEEDDCYEEVV